MSRVWDGTLDALVTRVVNAKERLKMNVQCPRTTEERWCTCSNERKP